MNEAQIQRLQRDVDRAVAMLQAVVAKARQEHSNAFLYLEASGYLHLMSGPAHSGQEAIPRRERVLTTTNTHHLMDGGEW